MQNIPRRPKDPSPIIARQEPTITNPPLQAANPERPRGRLDGHQLLQTVVIPTPEPLSPICGRICQDDNWSLRKPAPCWKICHFLLTLRLRAQRQATSRTSPPNPSIQTSLPHVIVSTTFWTPKASHHLDIQVPIPHQRLTNPTKSRSFKATEAVVVRDILSFIHHTCSPEPYPHYFSWNPPTPYERLSLAQPFSAP